MSLNWLDHITYEEIASTFIDTFPIISIGSCSGVHERRLVLLMNKDIICVDPLEYKWINTWHMPESVIVSAKDIYVYITGRSDVMDKGYYKDTFRNIVIYLAFDRDTHKHLFHRPDYKTIDDLISSKIELINSHLLIIWSSPNESTYDYDSIHLIKPKKITIVYEYTGSAGGEKLIKWINDLNNTKHIIISRLIKHHYIKKYKETFQIELICIECNW